MKREIHRYEEIDSTNMEAKRLAEAGAPHGTLVIAELQTAGRGRRGRRWNSPKGTGVWFSLLLKPKIAPGDASGLTLAAAMAVVRAIERVAGLPVQIKWPNDIVLSGKKVCGILTEMSEQSAHVDHIVVGIGINVKPRTFPPEIAETATYLGVEVSGMELIEAVLEEFEIYYEKYMQTLDASLFLREYENYLVNKDKQVKVLDPKGAYEGVARGINARGELLVEREGRVLTVNSGEVSVRGIYGYVP